MYIQYQEALRASRSVIPLPSYVTPCRVVTWRRASHGPQWFGPIQEVQYKRGVEPTPHTAILLLTLLW